jgi:uncharacterized protein YbjQ (UPF0145 family)
MIITTTSSVPNKSIVQILGIVQGGTIKTRHIGVDILASVKTIFGGELKGYSNLIMEAREEAMKRMEAEAKELKADAIVSFRLTTSDIMQGAVEILAYGTAVKLK